MSFFIILALLNGACITLSRILNGQLSISRGAFQASFVNHIGGFIFLSLILLITTQTPTLPSFSQWPLLTGGLLGALYVALNSVVLTRLGSTQAIILVISGQMFFGILLDILNRNDVSLLGNLCGVLLIVLGIVLKNTRLLTR